MKKVFAILLCLTLLVGLLPLQISAQANSGTCGENLTWVYDEETQTLEISGTGPMYDYSPENPAPWSDRRSVVNITINQGVTRVGAYSFRDAFLGFSRFSIAASVQEVGSQAFGDVFAAIMFWGSMPQFAPDAFAQSSIRGYFLDNWEGTPPTCQANSINWCGTILSKNVGNIKMLYQLGEDFHPADLGLQADGVADKFPYTPVEYSVENWDTDSVGEKTATVIADGVAYTHTYIVTDGKSHLDMIRVSGLRPFVEYLGQYDTHKLDIYITVGSQFLQEGIHYSVSYENATDVGDDAVAYIWGHGQWADLQIRHPYRILKKDISGDSPYAPDQTFAGTHLYPELHGTYWEDHVSLEKDNINIGTATYWKVGVGDFYGATQGTFEITDAADLTVELEGNYLGYYDQQPTGEAFYSSIIFPPGPFYGELDLDIPHCGYYELYRLEGETPVLVTTYETEWGRYGQTAFRYDFSHLYEPESGNALEIYLLGYSWIDEYGRLYSGVCAMYIPAKVPPATDMAVQMLEDSGDFRRVYFDAYGDGTLDNLTWSSSDPAVATVYDGIVTLLTPGSTVISAQSGELAVTVDLTVSPHSLNDCDFLGYDPETGKPALCLGNIPLVEGTDYALEYAQEDNGTYMEIVGKGLFTGSLRFMVDLAGQHHIHSFENCADTFCEDCGLLRVDVHTPGAEYHMDDTYHWYLCTGCGKQLGHAYHYMSGMKYDAQYHWWECLDCGIPLRKEAHDSMQGCSVCGIVPENLPQQTTPGDINGDGKVNNRDVTRLLQHLAGWEVAVKESALDVNGDGKVNNRDVTRLLQHLAGWDVTIH